MLDPEMRLIAGLLHASENDKQEFHLRQIPTDLYQMHRPEMTWIHRYRNNHQRFPSPQAFCAKFNVKLPRPKDPLNGLLEDVLERIQYTHLKTNVQRTRELLDAKAPMTSVIKQYQEDAAALQTYTVLNSVVDRGKSRTGERYYRERFLQNQDPGARRIMTPWPSLNKLCPALNPKDVFYIYARLNMGKTWFAQVWASYLASKGIKTLLASFEMSLTMMELRDECIRFGVSFSRFLEGKLSPRELHHYRQSKRAAQKDHYPLFISEPDNSENGFAAVEEEVHRIKPQVVIIDALYDAQHSAVSKIMSDPSKNAKRASLTKVLAKNTNTFLVGVLQSNRPSEDKKGKTSPSVNNVYNGDVWGQLGDYLFEITGQRGSKTRRGSLTKGRNSGIGDFIFDFDLDCPTLAENHLNVLDATDDDASTVTFTVK